MSASSPLPQRRRAGFSWPAGILAGGVLALLLVGAALWLFAGFGLSRWMDILRAGRTRIDVSQPTVVRQIRQLQRLETVSYTMDKIITGERSNPYLPNLLAGDRLLPVVHGEVIGGVDLAKVQPSDVDVQGRRVSLRLPGAEVFSTRIDSAKTRVYARDTGLFSSPDPNLESDVRLEAERQLQQAALQDGLLQSAGQNAQNTIATILKGLGFEQVEFR
ncbi:MAG: DUF4230 domain-containing protein [Terriglobales bacterium]